MKKQAITLKNRGMNRDTSVSKLDGSAAFENRNIRILARDHETLLSVTNERGNKEISLNSVIQGELLGWNTLNNHIVLFTHDGSYDRIYRIDYSDGTFTDTLLYQGNLNFDMASPIESVTSFETDGIQKIYWVDGRNVMRFMNFMADSTERAGWDDTTFDSNRIADFGVKVEITKDDTGATRANGVAQYVLSYFNKHGQETGYIWMSDLVYLSPKDKGGAADEYNNNKVTLTITNLDTSYTHFRIYSLVRSELDGQVSVFLVDEQTTSSIAHTVIDDGAHLTAEDPTRLLYLGSRSVIPGTMAYKDDTLFLGDMKSVGRQNYDELEAMIRQTMFRFNDGEEAFTSGTTWESNCVTFFHSAYNFITGETGTLPFDFPKEEGNYPYENQLRLTSGQILTFKGGEKYRFALKFRDKNGVESDAFWIGDKENSLYPVIDNNHNRVLRICAYCDIPQELLTYLRENTEFKTVQLMIAEAGYADRSVKAQGIVNPTMFNVWERFQKRTYAIPSWISRVRGGVMPYMHFDNVDHSSKVTGEIQCNWWDNDDIDHAPYFQYSGWDGPDPNPVYLKDVGVQTDYDMIMFVYRLRYKEKKKEGWLSFGNGLLTSVMPLSRLILAGKVQYKVLCNVIKGKMYLDTGSSYYSQVLNQVYTYDIAAYDDEENDKNGKKAHSKAFQAFWTPQIDPDTGRLGYYHDITYTDSSDNTEKVGATLRLVTFEYDTSTIFNQGGAKNNAYQTLVNKLVELDLGAYAPTNEEFVNWCTWATHARGTHKHRIYVNKNVSGESETISDTYDSMYKAVNMNSVPTSARWISAGEFDVLGEHGNYSAAYHKKHLMFIDENVVTLDSPELEKETVQLGNSDLKFRIVGVAKMSSTISDYTIDATHSNVDGKSFDRENFSGNRKEGNGLMGIISWPLWREYALSLSKNADPDKEEKERDSSDYHLGSRIIRYMLYLWHHNGSITGFTGRTDDKDKDEEDLTIVDTDYSKLNHKTFANLRFAHSTVYFNTPYNMTAETIRQVQEYGVDYVGVDVAGSRKDYNGRVSFSLSMPGNLKYPLYYSNTHHDETNDSELVADGAWLYSALPVQLEYSTPTHAVISLKTWNEHVQITSAGRRTYYRQTILPYLFDQEKVDFSGCSNPVTTDEGDTITPTGALLPWIDSTVGVNYVYYDPAIWSAISIVEEAYSDADFSFVTKIKIPYSGSTKAFVDTIIEAMNYFQTESVYFSVPSYNDNYISMWSVVELNTNDMEFTSDGTYCNILFTDKKSIAWGSSEHAETINVQYYTSAGYQGLGELDVWNNSITPNAYPYKDYSVLQEKLGNIPNDTSILGSEAVSEGEQYLFIGEIYQDFSSSDSRYGGISESAVENNRFITAGPVSIISETARVYANQGDTYFQRWDSLRIKPYSEDALNQNIDITSVMLESHINLDGRTDMQRGIPELASADLTKFNSINRVYTQQNNYVVRRDLDEDFNTDTFRSSVTWTLPKHDMAKVDEWTHITLANNLKLDGDKGICRALRRFQNRLVAFQDRGIAEIYFNAMTQIGTQEGVPIEISNSGKVSGKGYFTNKYGCLNKWSIAEGKNGVYFVDNINKAFCRFSVGQGGGLGVSDLSTAKGFGVWFRKKNDITSWLPEQYNNFVSFYDRIHSDVYVVSGDTNDDAPCIVYNELLDEFTSFFDYGSVPMMTNLEDRFLSFKDGKLWLQNEGKYCNFFGEQYDFWSQYRVTPDPYGDKIWTNLEYRADFYRVLDGDEELIDIPDGSFTDATGDFYMPDETFDFIRFWNEYQTTSIDESNMVSAEKKFRIWRYQIPRAVVTETNRFGLDRMRNPWLNILLKKKYTGVSDETNQDLMQMHDMSVIYYE